MKKRKKQHINITIDQDISIELATKDINISQTINDFLRSYLMKDLNLPKDIQELTEAIQDLKQQIKTTKENFENKISKLTSELIQHNNQLEAAMKEAKEKAATEKAEGEAWVDGIKRSGILSHLRIDGGWEDETRGF